MKAKKPILLVVLLAFVLVLAFAPAASRNRSPSPHRAHGPGWAARAGRTECSSSGHLFIKGYEIGQWSGTFTATNTYENYVGTVWFDPANPDTWYSLRAKLWIHFADATVDMGGGVLLHGDMTMLVVFDGYDWVQGATWKIHNGTRGLKHLGGAGTLVGTTTGMDYAGTIWTQK